MNVAAVVVSFSSAQTREGALDLILDLDEKELYLDFQAEQIPLLEDEKKPQD